MRKLFHKLNNQGSTFITVIVCLAFIGILGSLIMSVTMTNLQMKMVERKSKQNFYSGEGVLEEIRVALQEMTAEVIKEVYEKEVLPSFAQYMSMTDFERNEKVQNMVVLNLVKRLGLTEGLDDAVLLNPDTEIAVRMEAFHPYISEPEYTRISMDYLTGSPAKYYLSQSEPYFEGASVLIRNIKAVYEKDNYRTSLMSDIRIELPKFALKEGDEIIHYQMEQPYKDYALVASSGIRSDNFMGSNQIQGSVYAGEEGILVDGQNGSHEMIMDGDNIVTKGNITVANQGQLKIGMTSNPTLWADNLVTLASYPLAGATKLNIHGRSIIRDDLVLDGQNSEVKLSGVYVGYTAAFTSQGSAMMINGSGSSLDLSNLSQLILAGRAHISIEDEILIDDMPITKSTEILTGESLALKGNQRAYLIPGKFIEGILHNPVTRTDITMPDGSVKAPHISLDAANPGDLKYEDYVLDTPYKLAAKQTVTGSTASTLLYYYWNFKNGKEADRYLKDYLNQYPDILDKMEPFALGEVRLPRSENIRTVGNLMSYAGGKVILTPGLSSSYSDDISLNQYINELTLDGEFGAPLSNKTLGMLNDFYHRICQSLTLEGDYWGKGEGKDILTSTIIQGGIDYVIDNGLGLSDGTAITVLEPGESYSNDDISKKSFVLARGDTTISGYFKGFLMAKGDITISPGTMIDGIIISTGEEKTGAIQGGNILVGGDFGSVNVNGRLVASGDIILKNNCYIQVSEDYIGDLFQNEGRVLNYLFKNTKKIILFTESLPVDDLVDLSDMIFYENWRRVE